MFKWSNVGMTEWSNDRMVEWKTARRRKRGQDFRADIRVQLAAVEPSIGGRNGYAWVSIAGSNSKEAVPTGFVPLSKSIPSNLLWEQKSIAK